MEIVVVVVLLAAGYAAAKVLANQARRKKLMAKYGDADAVDMIMRRMMWRGMSADMLVDALGRPAATDTKVYKTKVRETYKYNQAGRNRFRNRVTVENGVVVGWDQK